MPTPCCRIILKASSLLQEPNMYVRVGVNYFFSITNIIKIAALNNFSITIIITITIIQIFSITNTIIIRWKLLIRNTITIRPIFFNYKYSYNYRCVFPRFIE